MKDLKIDTSIHKRLGFTILDKPPVRPKLGNIPYPADEEFTPSMITFEEAQAAMKKCMA